MIAPSKYIVRLVLISSKKAPTDVSLTYFRVQCEMILANIISQRPLERGYLEQTS